MFLTKFLRIPFSLRRHLDISQAIMAETSPLHIASNRTGTGNLCFPGQVSISKLHYEWTRKKSQRNISYSNINVICMKFQCSIFWESFCKFFYSPLYEFLRKFFFLIKCKNQLMIRWISLLVIETYEKSFENPLKNLLWKVFLKIAAFSC